MAHARIRSTALVLFASAFMICFGMVANHHLNLGADNFGLSIRHAGDSRQSGICGSKYRLCRGYVMPGVLLRAAVIEFSCGSP